MINWLTRDEASYPFKLCSIALALTLVIIMFQSTRQPTVLDEIITRAEVIHVSSRTISRNSSFGTNLSFGRVRLPDGLEANVAFGNLTPTEGEFLPVRVQAFANGHRRVVFNLGKKARSRVAFCVEQAQHSGLTGSNTARMAVFRQPLFLKGELPCITP